MNVESNVVPATMPETRPMYWSVRRELWENRSIYIAPLVVAAVVLFGFLISTIGMPGRRRALLMLAPEQQRATIGMPYHLAATMLILTAFIVGVFYCLDALHGERRDRSILFWKSLPVSDRIAVLSKSSIPLVFLPLLVFALTLTTHLIMLLSSTVKLLGNEAGVATVWRLPFFQLWLALLYALVAIALWHTPIYAWMLLVSAWVRRATFLWAVFPFLAVAAFEKGAFNTSYVGSFLNYRLLGWFKLAFVPHQHGSVPIEPLAAITPGKLLSAPDLWIGLVFAALFLAAAVRLRRNREPI